MRNAISLYWSGGSKSGVNYGDALSPAIIEILSGKKVKYSPIYRCDVVAIGSVLEKLFKNRWKRLLYAKVSPVSVWGTGSMFHDSMISTFNTQILSVRGRLTASKLKLPQDTPIGDPGILADLLLPTGDRRKKFKWGIVPHFVDFADPRVCALSERIPRSTVIDVKDPDVRETTRRISECEYVLSSSLHGLIAADALGIPNIRMIVTNKLAGGNWKFDDYSSSLGNRQMLLFNLNDNADLNAIEKEIKWNYSPHIGTLKKETVAAFKKLRL